MIPLLAAAASPLIKALMKKGFTTLAGAVANKGKEFVEEKLGVKLEEDITPELALKYKELELDREQDLRAWSLENRKLDLEEVKAADANTANARQMNEKIQESAQTTRFVKEAAYYIDFLVVGSTILTALALFVFKIPMENKELAYTFFGGLLTLTGTIINFHRGTSARSSQKDDTIRALSQGSGK